MNDGVLAWLVIGVVAGALIGRGNAPGERVIVNIIAGIAGAFVGGLLARLAGAQGAGAMLLSFLTAFAGAISAIFAMRLARRGSSG